MKTDNKTCLRVDQDVNEYSVYLRQWSELTRGWEERRLAIITPNHVEFGDVHSGDMISRSEVQFILSLQEFFFPRD